LDKKGTLSLDPAFSTPGIQFLLVCWKMNLQKDFYTITFGDAYNPPGFFHLIDFAL